MAHGSGTAPEAALPSGLLEHSDERDRYMARITAAWQEGFAAGREAGWREGYETCEASFAALWRKVTRPVAHPVAYARERAARALRAAEAGERRDQAEHEKAFLEQARATAPGERSEPQAAALTLPWHTRHLRSAV